MAMAQNLELMKHERREKLLKIIKNNPHIRSSALAKKLGVKKSTINNDIRELTDELKDLNPQTYHLHRERMLNNLHRMMKHCEKKLNMCRGATAGTRWVEEWTKLFEKEAKILGVYTPDRSIVGHVDLDNMISKEQRDAAMDAIIIGKKKGLIDATQRGNSN